MSVSSTIALWLLYTTITQGVVFRFVLGKGGFDLWAKVLFINIASFLIALAIGVAGFFSLGWPFVTSWGMAHWFLLTIISEFLPLAVIFGDFGFRRIFIMLIFSNFMSCLVLSFFILYLPQALMIPSLEINDYENRVKDGIAVIKDAIEGYRNNNGQYPAYIYGGDPISWRGAGEPLDPLLKGGYLEAYPTNVFHLGRNYFFPRRRRDFAGVFWGVEGERFKELKRVWKQVVWRDPRFGYRGTRMGNILSDPVIPSSYKWFDLHVYRGTSKDNQFFLPGAFLYKAFDLDGNGRFDGYILAGLGSEETVGEDIYNQKEDSVAYLVAGKLVPGNRDLRRDGVIIVETGGFKKWRE